MVVGLLANVMIGIIAVVVARWLLPLAGFVIIGLARLPAEGRRKAANFPSTYRTRVTTDFAYSLRPSERQHGFLNKIANKATRRYPIRSSLGVMATARKESWVTDDRGLQFDPD
jgi:hypothetical protein